MGKNIGKIGISLGSILLAGCMGSTNLELTVQEPREMPDKILEPICAYKFGRNTVALAYGLEIDEDFYNREGYHRGWIGFVYTLDF